MGRMNKVRKKREKLIPSLGCIESHLFMLHVLAAAGNTEDATRRKEKDEFLNKTSEPLET